MNATKVPPSSWPILLQGGQGEQALEKVVKIGAEPRRYRESQGLSSPCDLTLHTGMAGIAIFFAYLEKVMPSAGYGEDAATILEQLMGGLSRMPVSRSLFRGPIGIAWVVEHLGPEYIADFSGAVGEDLAAAVSRSLGVPALWREDYSLLSGIVGAGLYSLERGENSWGIEGIEKAVALLEGLAEAAGSGLTWKTPVSRLSHGLQECFSTGLYNLGMAVGIPGVISFLASLGSRVPGATSILAPATHWLLLQRRSSQSESSFPYLVPDEGRDDCAQLAWCYGDLGIASSLLSAAKALGRDDLRANALDIATRCAQRSPKSVRCVDASLCHGAAGVAHSFSRLGRDLRSDLLLDAARHWFRKLLEIGTGEGTPSYLYSRQDGDAIRRLESPGLLVGLAGTGLALLAAISNVVPRWDRLLLLSGWDD